MTNDDKIELGDEVENIVTQLRGIAIATTTWLNGCVRILVQPQGRNKDDKPFDTWQADIEEIRIITKAKVPRPAAQRDFAPVPASRSGGDQSFTPTR